MSEKTRVFVPMTAETRAAFQAYADAKGTFLAAACGEILQNTAPVALEMANVLERAKEAPVAAMRQASEALDRQMAEINQQKLDLRPKKRKKRA